MSQILEREREREAVPPAAPAPGLSSGSRALAELQKRREKANTRIEARKQELERLETEIDLGRPDLGGSGVPNFVPLTPPDEDARFFSQFEQDPLILATFGGGGNSGNSGNSGSGSGVKGVVANTNTTNNNISSTETESLSDAASASVSAEPNTGILSGVSRRFGFLGWLDKSRWAVGISGGLLTICGLYCLWILLATLTPTPSSAGLATPTEAVAVQVIMGAVGGSTTPGPGLEATVTAQAGQLTAGAGQLTAIALRPTATLPPPPTLTPLVATATTLAPPTATTTPDFSQDPHGGLLPPGRLSAPKLGFLNDKVRRFTTTADGKTLVSGPPKGIIYHFGAYPGERPGNVVMLGDYDTLGSVMELLQANDLLEVADRNGGVYVYRVLPYDVLDKLASSSGLTPTPTATAGPSANGNGNSGPNPLDRATAVAAIPDQIEKITTYEDTSLVEKPLNSALSILTLVSWERPLLPADPAPGVGRSADDPVRAGRRYAIRAKFVSYNPVSNLPPGTPVGATAVSSNANNNNKLVTTGSSTVPPASSAQGQSSTTATTGANGAGAGVPSLATPTVALPAPAPAASTVVTTIPIPIPPPPAG